MALYLKLAIRNVFRNRRRTSITVAAMGFGAETSPRHREMSGLTLPAAGQSDVTVEDS